LSTLLSNILEKFVSALREKGYCRQTVFDRYARIVSFLKVCSKKFGTKRVVELNDGPSRIPSLESSRWTTR
jgi:hypothetical protein